jgi:hypothetical protein
MLRQRSILAVGTLSSVAGGGIVVLALLLGRPGITRANFDRIEMGMTQVEVETLLGGPPDDIAPNGRDWSMLRFA